MIDFYDLTMQKIFVIGLLTIQILILIGVIIW